jgi:transglutaminase-like putative cysteine protease
VISEPFRGAPHTVAHIKRVALEAQGFYPLRLLAEDVCGQLGSKDYLSEILALYYWVLSHTRYANDPRTVELVRSPREVLGRLQRAVTQLRAGWRPSLDCDDLTALLVAIFLAMGREVRIVTVAFRNAFFRGQRQFQHVYVQVREPRSGQWIVLDPVAAEATDQMLSRVKAVKIWPIA